LPKSENEETHSFSGNPAEGMGFWLYKSKEAKEMSEYTLRELIALIEQREAEEILKTGGISCRTCRYFSDRGNYCTLLGIEIDESGLENGCDEYEPH